MSADDAIRERIDAVIASDRVVLFMKGTRQQPQCGFSATTVGILDSMLPDYVTINVLEMDVGAAQKARGLEVDMVETLQGTGFEIKNPNAPDAGA